MNIDWFTFAAQIVNFVVLVYLLNHFLYGPITGAMEKREASIAARLNEADQRESEANSEFKHYQVLTQQIEHQRKQSLDEVRAESETMRQKLITEAKNEVRLRRDEWMESLQREKATMVSLFRQRASQQVIDISRNALSQLADTELEQRATQLFVKHLKEVSTSEKNRLKREFESVGQSQVHTAFAISENLKRQIRKGMIEELGLQTVSFVTTPELICGIELHIGGTKIGWSVQEYLESLSDEMEEILAKQ